MAHDANMPVVEIHGLKKIYRMSARGLFQTHSVRAVNDVDLTIRQGETFGIVGESGCGKSTVARLIMGLEKPDAGEILFRGTRIDNIPEGKRRELRPKFQMVFQDSGSSLNPRKRVVDILSEPMLYHGVCNKKNVMERVDELLTQVGLPAEFRSR